MPTTRTRYGRDGRGYLPPRRRGWGRGLGRGEPVPLFVYPDHRVSLIDVVGLVFRAAWRYRSEMAPPYWTVGVVVTGAWLHGVHPRWWPVPAVLALAGSLVLVRLPRRIERVARRWPVLNRRAERIWAAVVCAASGAWLTAATVWGVGAGPLPGFAVMGMIAVGLPWWYHRGRRRRVRVRRVMEDFGDIAARAGLDGAQILSVMLDRWGWTARLRLRRGQHSRDAVEAIPALESALHTRVGAIRVEPVPARADRVVMRVIETDPHAEPIPWPGTHPDSQPGSRPVGKVGAVRGKPDRSLTRSVTRPVTVGVWEDGQPVNVVLLRRHALIGGVTGSGKSGLLNVILAELASCADVTLWGIDLKNGMELGPWRSCLQRLAVTHDQAVRVLRAGVAELERRAGLLAERGEREWTPTPDDPALVIVVDEYAELPDEAQVLADSIARRGRAVAVSLLAATQKPSQAAMGKATAVRSQMDVRFCLRVRERRDTDMILGQGMLTAGWDATKLDAPGKFLLSAPEHTTPRRARAYLIGDKQINTTAARHARPDNAANDDAKENTPQGAASEDRPDPIGDPRREVIDPERALWAALRDAPDHGATIAELMAACGMSRPWLYRQLKDHQTAGRVIQTYRGRWRATSPRDRPGDPGPGGPKPGDHPT